MTALLPISRRTTNPRLTLRARWSDFRLRHFASVQEVYFQGLHDSLPLNDPDRHAMEPPAIEDAFALLAVASTAIPTTMRAADHEQLLLAERDTWFRHAHPAPQHLWSPAEVTAYNRLMATVHVTRPASGGRS
ncbi:hypothetical protein [Streptomyces sp. NPDC001089]